MPALQLGHAGINVTDLARSVAFYREIFEFELIDEGVDGDRRWAFLGFDGTVMVTLWQQSAGEFSTDRPGLHHLALLVDDLEAVRAAEAKVRAAGAHLFHDGVVPHAEGVSSGGIFFSDPDGIRLEVCTASGADVAEAPTGAAPTCGFF